MEIIIKKLISPASINFDLVQVHQIDQRDDEYIILYSHALSSTPLNNSVLVVKAVLFNNGKKITVDECNKILSSNSMQNVRILKGKDLCTTL